MSVSLKRKPYSFAPIPTCLLFNDLDDHHLSAAAAALHVTDSRAALDADALEAEAQGDERQGRQDARGLRGAREGAAGIAAAELSLALEELGGGQDMPVARARRAALAIFVVPAVDQLTAHVLALTAQDGAVVVASDGFRTLQEQGQDQTPATEKRLDLFDRDIGDITEVRGGLVFTFHIHGLHLGGFHVVDDVGVDDDGVRDVTELDVAHALLLGSVGALLALNTVELLHVGCCWFALAGLLNLLF